MNGVKVASNASAIRNARRPVRRFLGRFFSFDRGTTSASAFSSSCSTFQLLPWRGLLKRFTVALRGGFFVSGFWVRHFLSGSCRFNGFNVVFSCSLITRSTRPNQSGPASGARNNTFYISMVIYQEKFINRLDVLRQKYNVYEVHTAFGVFRSISKNPVQTCGLLCFAISTASL